MKKLSSELIAEMKRLSDEGYTVDMLAEKYRVSVNTMHGRLHKYNIHPRRKNKPSYISDDVVTDYTSGMSRLDILAKHKITDQTLSRIIRETKTPKRSRFTEAQQLEICRLYAQEKYSSPELAQKYDTWPSEIYIILHRHGISRRTHAEAEAIRRTRYIYQPPQ